MTKYGYIGNRGLSSVYPDHMASYHRFGAIGRVTARNYRPGNGRRRATHDGWEAVLDAYPGVRGYGETRDLAVDDAKDKGERMVDRLTAGDDCGRCEAERKRRGAEPAQLHISGDGRLKCDACGWQPRRA